MITNNVLSLPAARCRFQQLLQDVFPSAAVNEVHEEMKAAIHKAAATLNLQVIPEQVT